MNQNPPLIKYPYLSHTRWRRTGMVFTHQGQPAMKTATCLSLKWRLLARVASPSSSAAIHFFGFRIRPSCSEIFKRRRISFRSSRSVKFLGRLGKIEVFFISNPRKRCCLYFKQFRISLLILLLNTAHNIDEVSTLNLGGVGTVGIELARS